MMNRLNTITVFALTDDIMSPTVNTFKNTETQLYWWLQEQWNARNPLNEKATLEKYIGVL